MMQWYQNKPIVGLSWLIWALFCIIHKRGFVPRISCFPHFYFFQKRKKSLKQLDMVDRQIWKSGNTIFFNINKTIFPRASTLHCGRGPRSSPHLRKSLPRRRRSTKTRQYSTCLVLGIIKVLHYIVEMIHLNKVKKQAFRPCLVLPQHRPCNVLWGRHLLCLSGILVPGVGPHLRSCPSPGKVRADISALNAQTISPLPGLWRPGWSQLWSTSTRCAATWPTRHATPFLRRRWEHFKALHLATWKI